MTAFLRSMLLAVTSALAPVAARTSTLTGTGLDLKDYDGTVRIALHGVRAGGDLTPTLEMSDSLGSGYVAVPAGAMSTPPGATAFGPIIAGTDFLRQVDVDVSQTKGFIRFIGTASNTPNHTYGVTATGMKKQT